MVHALSIAPTPIRNANQYAIVRRIHNCTTSDQVIDIVEKEGIGCCFDSDYDIQYVLAEALTRCGKLKNSNAALKILDLVPDSELCRARTISICGSCGNISDAMILLSQRPLKTPGPYNSAIAACRNTKNWQGALNIIATMPNPMVTSVTVNALLATLGRTSRGTEALHILRTMEKKWNINPDRISYHSTLSALLGNGQIKEACNLVQEMANSGQPEIHPNKDTFNRIASAVAGKEAARAIVVDILGDQIAVHSQTREFAEFQRWKLQKVGRGKSAYWKIGQVSIEGETNPIIVGISPNRNPATNGIRLNFYRSTISSSSISTTSKSQKLGFLLMINSANDSCGAASSQFLGQWVDENERGRGWAKVWLAVWLQLCLDAGIQPRTGNIHKPLLCLVLQHSFGMLANEGGVDMELSQGSDARTIMLYSSSRALFGVFSPLDLRKQYIELSLVPSNPRGREIVVGTSFQWPGETALIERVSAILGNRWKLVEEVAAASLREILLGI